MEDVGVSALENGDNQSRKKTEAWGPTASMAGAEEAEHRYEDSGGKKSGEERGWNQGAHREVLDGGVRRGAARKR